MKINRYGQAKVLDSQELDLVINYLPSKFHQVLALTLRNTGARISEVIQLTWRDVEKESILFPKTIVKRKLKSREIFISESFYKCLMDWKQEWTLFKGRKPLPEDYIFYGRFDGSHITSRAFFLALQKSLERAEIVGATSHSFRRSALTKLHKSGLPLKIIQSLSGHSSLNTLSLYLQVSDEDKKRAISLLA
tara:strand:+ start:305 stop:880 length:576 start_codon:yes stop_codon:yes gene_type:complete